MAEAQSAQSNQSNQSNPTNQPNQPNQPDKTDKTDKTDQTQTFPNHPDLKEIKLENVNLTHNKPPLKKDQKWVKSLTFKNSTVEFSYQPQDNNRMLQSYESEDFLTVNFLDLRFENQNTATYIFTIVSAGIVINDKRYYYLGQSNSQLKERKCFLINREPKEIEKILKRFGDWTKFTNIAKLSKRIGLLFSSGENALILPSDCYKKIPDIKRNDHCFTDGCGYVSKDIIKKVQKSLSLEFRQKRHYPSVIQIRYQGFKGILLLGNHLKGMACEFRKSMDKFKYGEDAPNNFFVVDYSKPYTFGRLNLQTVMLLSSLGISDDIILKKQAQHFDRLELMFNDLPLAFEYLLTNGRVDLAGDLFENGYTENVVQYLHKSYKYELETSLKIKKNSKGTKELEKLRIIVEKSRVVFAAADPTIDLQESERKLRILQLEQTQTEARMKSKLSSIEGDVNKLKENLTQQREIPKSGINFNPNKHFDKMMKETKKAFEEKSRNDTTTNLTNEQITEELKTLREKEFKGKLRKNECFFRPTIQNEPTTIVGPIFCVRNPCYHAGDVVVLEAVHLPECENIVDVLLFSVESDVPAAHRSAGGDLDGDKFFVCWDEELIPQKAAESYGYPGAKEVINLNIQRDDLIKNFSNHSNAGVARCADLFTKWADARDPRCEQCLQINKLFSHAVDGQSVKIPKNLETTPNISEQDRQSKVWNRLVKNAEEKRKQSEKVKNDDQLMKMDREELYTFLEEDGYEATDYELFNFLIRWCHTNHANIAEFLYYIDFSTFKSHEKLDSAVIDHVPRHLLQNALNMSRIVESRHIDYFGLGNSWKLFHCNNGGVNQIVSPAGLTHDLMNAVTNFRRVLISLEFDHELTFVISLYGEFFPDIENDAEDRINIYGFNRGIQKKKFCMAHYKLYYNEGHFQIYVSQVRNTFIWLGISKNLENRVISLNELNVKSYVSIAVDKLCRQTSRVTSRIRKKEITGSEIYVKSDRDGLPTRYQAVNTDYEMAMEEIDIDIDYNPPNKENPENDNDKNLLSLSFTEDLKELIVRMECCAKYGLYDTAISSLKMYLSGKKGKPLSTSGQTLSTSGQALSTSDQTLSTSDLNKLVDFLKKNNPVFHSPLTAYVTSNANTSLEIKNTPFTSLISACLKASKCPKDALVLENVLHLLQCCSVTLNNMEVCKIINDLIVDFPHSETALSYVDDIFEMLENKHQPLENTSPLATKVVPYFMKQIKLLCIETLEEHCSYSSDNNNVKKKPLNCYKITGTKNRYTLAAQILPDDEGADNKKTLSDDEETDDKTPPPDGEGADNKTTLSDDKGTDDKTPPSDGEGADNKTNDEETDDKTPPSDGEGADNKTNDEETDDKTPPSDGEGADNKTPPPNGSKGRLIQVRSGDLIELKRIKTTYVEQIPAIRALVISIEPDISIDVPWAPHDFTTATWEAKKVGNIIGFSHTTDIRKIPLNRYVLKASKTTLKTSETTSKAGETTSKESGTTSKADETTSKAGETTSKESETTPKASKTTSKSSKAKKNHYTLVQTGSVHVKVRPGDLVELKRLNLKSVEPIPVTRATVLSTEPVVSIKVSWSPRDITMATWEVKQVGNIIGFKHSIEAIKKLYPKDNGISPLINILLEPEKYKETSEDPSTTSSSQELDSSQQTTETNEDPSIVSGSQDQATETSEDPPITSSSQELDSSQQTAETNEDPSIASGSQDQAAETTEDPPITSSSQELDSSQQTAETNEDPSIASGSQDQATETTEDPPITSSSQELDSSQQTAETNEDPSIASGSQDQAVETSEDPPIASSNEYASLNPGQKTAIDKAENGRLTLWQGPAGTGKTKSIFALILCLLNRNPNRILMTATTNAAVDNVALLLVKHGNIKIIRIGSIGVVHPGLRSITLEAGLDGEIKKAHTKRKKLLEEAKIVCATCVGSGTTLLKDHEYDFIIIDEASQVSEPEVLIPLAKNCSRFVMVGDHEQLRPFCQPIAGEYGYNISLFERMAEKDYPVCLLNIQYRMHPGISEFPNNYIYKGKLSDGVTAENRPLVDGFDWPNKNVPVAFVSVRGEESFLKGFTSKGSKYNQAEVDKIVEVLKEIVKKETKLEIGIVSLYTAQLEKMKEALSKDNDLHEIEVKTADGFQGREKDLILITCVRCNEHGNVGFLKDKRRFNVMLTRARRGLIVFGDRKTLCSDEMWKEWFLWIDSNGLTKNDSDTISHE